MQSLSPHASTDASTRVCGATAPPAPQVSLALTDTGLLAGLLALGERPSLSRCLSRLGWPAGPLEALGLELRVERFHLGNEFCERLLPTPAELEQALEHLETLGAAVTLLTPLMTDSGIKRLRSLLDRLPAGSEVVVNDWGALRLVKNHGNALRPLLGRLLYKMIKDPRLPSAQWTRLHPHSARSAPFQQLLQRMGIDHLEMDLPPFTQAEQFLVGELALSVHLPYGYVVKGRMCRIGSLGQGDTGKFIAGHACRKECLDYVAMLDRPPPKPKPAAKGVEKGGEGKLENAAPPPGEELVGFQRGNTQFYRYSTAMEAKVVEAVRQGLIQRLVFAGDWNEHRCPSQSA